MEENVFQRLRRLEARLERRRRSQRIPRNRLKDREDPMTYYTDEKFKLRFHIFKDTAVYITSLISKDLCYYLKRGCQLSPIQQFLIAQRFFVTGAFQILIGDAITLQVSQSTVSKVVRRVACAIGKQRAKYIKFPNEAELPTVRDRFYEIGNFPGVVGVIDGTHVKIDSPGGTSAELFRNRKGCFSINVQGICNPSLNFTDIVARWYGSAHDSRILENSAIGMDLEAGRVPGMLLGDSGYGLSHFLMTPVHCPTCAAERRYNVAQRRTRNSIERCFGAWKRRFPCLNHLRLKLDTSLVVIVATAVIHNISRDRMDLFEEPDDDMEIMDMESDEEDIVVPHTASGKATQRALILSHFST